VKYGFIKVHTTQFSVSLLCDVLSVSRSGYYAWINHKPSKRDVANQELDKEISLIYQKHKGRYGAPRITRALKASSIPCSQTRVEKRMYLLNLKAVAKRKLKVTTDSNHSSPVYNNRLKRDFTTTGINQKWVSDITYVPTDEGWVYVAVVIDLYSRAVIGWSMSKRMKKDLVCDALMMGLFKRKFPKNVIVHSDRGSQYCSLRYRQIIKNNQLIGSMSRRGNCWDNAIAESFFHSLKVELIHQEHYATRDAARQSIFQYIEGYYNQNRKHSSIDYKTPFEVECAV